MVPKTVDVIRIYIPELVESLRIGVKQLTDVDVGSMLLVIVLEGPESWFVGQLRSCQVRHDRACFGWWLALYIAAVIALFTKTTQLCSAD